VRLPEVPIVSDVRLALRPVGSPQPMNRSSQRNQGLAGEDLRAGNSITSLKLPEERAPSPLRKF